jgi:predicted MPP superfamily phosphohydrolase
LRAGIAGGVALTMASPALAEAGDPIKIIEAAPPRGGKPFRIAHLTDMHVTEKHHAQAGFGAALQSLKQIDPAPELLLTGGDHIMDALVQTRERAIEQWDMYTKILADKTNIKAYACMGNHDVWGQMANPYSRPAAGSAVKVPDDTYTAVCVDTNLGQRIVLLRHYAAGDWWSRIYKVESPSR